MSYQENGRDSGNEISTEEKVRLLWDETRRNVIPDIADRFVGVEDYMDAATTEVELPKYDSLILESSSFSRIGHYSTTFDRTRHTVDVPQQGRSNPLSW